MDNPKPVQNLILVCDDEPLVIRAVTIAISEAGFRAITAENGRMGLEVFEAHQDEICLVIVDLMMPEMGGVEMAEAVSKLKPGVKILLMSGYSDAVLKAESGGRFAILRKPFLGRDLIGKIQSMLASAEAV